MNSRKQENGILDKSLNRLLKNWVNRKDLPTSGRKLLLAAAAQQEMSSSHILSSFRWILPKFSFGWTFRFQTSLDAFSARPVYGFSLESAYSLRANMGVL